MVHERKPPPRAARIAEQRARLLAHTGAAAGTGANLAANTAVDVLNALHLGPHDHILAGMLAARSMLMSTARGLALAANIPFPLAVEIAFDLITNLPPNVDADTEEARCRDTE